MNVTRRTMLSGTVALGTVGLLAACGGSKSGGVGGKAASSADELVNNLQINKQDVSSLKQGGELKLSVGALGPNFNVNTLSGYTTTNLAAFGGPCNLPATVGFFNMDPAGAATANPDFITEYKNETKDGVQTIEFKLHPSAAFNDGTPIDVDAVEAFWTVFAQGTSAGYNLTDTPVATQMKSFEAVGGDKKHVRITMSTPFYLGENVGTNAMHPALVDKELFNNGFVDNPQDKYWAGPFKIGEWSSSSKTLTLVRNEKWWGTKPVLDKIIWREMTTEAARAGFANGELDAMNFTRLNDYNAVKDVAGTDIRRSQNTGVSNLQFNATRVEDLALRRATFAAVDRKALNSIAYGQIGWEEDVPGSLIAMPFQKGYEDNYPKNVGVDAAKKILEDAGYTLSGDYYVKDGKTAGYKLSSIGNDPSVLALFQTFEQQLKKAGIKVENETVASSNANSVLGTKNYDAIFSGWGVSALWQDSAQYFYVKSINNGVGTDELDELCAKVAEAPTEEEQFKLANEAEKKHMEEVAIYLPYGNGPTLTAAKSKLANYGPQLFKLSYTNADLWTQVGWQN